MKKLLIAPALVLSISIFGQTDANAGDTPVAQAPRVTAVPAGFVFKLTTIKGDIAVPSTFTASGYGNPASLSSFSCSNLVVIANSQATKPKPAGYDGIWTSPPVWTRSANATGTWSSGKCSYSLTVPGDQSFNLTAGTNGDFNCSNIDVTVTSTPSWQSVPKGTTKVDNIAVTKVNCNIIG